MDTGVEKIKQVKVTSSLSVSLVYVSFTKSGTDSGTVFIRSILVLFISTLTNTQTTKTELETIL